VGGVLFRPNPPYPIPYEGKGKIWRGSPLSEAERGRTPANPKPTGVGKGGSRGAKPPWQGVWGCPPQNQN